MSFIKNRQNPLTDTPTEEIESAFKSICDYFGVTWLECTDGLHRLQSLWSRRDSISTIELFTFGVALKKISSIDSKWLNHQVKVIKKNDQNNQNGAIFEILAASHFLVDGQQILPSPINQKGYDLDLVLAHNLRWRVSIKSYSKSTHENLFIRKMEIVRQKLITIMKNNVAHIQFFVSAKTYPSESNWQKLIASLRDFLINYKGIKLSKEIDNFWTLTAIPLNPDKEESFARNYFSYTLIGIAPYHRNEQNNFVSKLEAAVSNLSKHIKTGDDYHAFTLIRLPSTASVVTLKNWVNTYLAENSSSILDGVIFIQPYISSFNNRNSSFVAYHYASSLSSCYIQSKNKLAHMEVPVGVNTLQPPVWKLQAGKEETILENSYIFQRGEHYTLMKTKLNGSLEGNILRKAPGIHTHIVLKDDANTPTITGRWGEDLYLIGS